MIIKEIVFELLIACHIILYVQSKLAKLKV
jgi:hypothetical protein